MPDPTPHEPDAPDSPHIANLKAKRADLVAKMERIAAMPVHRDHDNDATLARCRNGIAEIDRELKEAK